MEIDSESLMLAENQTCHFVKAKSDIEFLEDIDGSKVVTFSNKSK